MSDYTPTSWAAALLAKLGVPVTSANVSAITAWETAEGGNWHNSDRYNPLNTTQPAAGAIATNSAGVKAYTSWDQGLQATVATLRNGHYGGILSALARGTSADDVVSAVLASPWGTKAISLGGSSAASAAPADATQALSVPGLNSVAGAVTKVAFTVAFVGGGLLLVVLGLARGTTAGRRVSDAAGQRVKAATEAAAVA
jgi:hypothetical protein